MAQIMIRFASVFLMMFLCSQSFAGVFPGRIFVNPDGNISSTVAFNGSTIDSSSSPLSQFDFDGILAQHSSSANAFGTISVNGIATAGALTETVISLPSSTNPSGVSFVQQGTTGGDFELFDQNNSLLLSGTFGNGDLSGFTGNGTGSTTGTFTSTDVVFDQAGSLRPHIKPDGSFALSLIIDGGLEVNSPIVSGPELAPFTASIVGIIDVNGVHPTGAVPEPGTLAIFGTICLVACGRRRIS